MPALPVIRIPQHISALDNELDCAGAPQGSEQPEVKVELGLEFLGVLGVTGW